MSKYYPNIDLSKVVIMSYYREAGIDYAKKLFVDGEIEIPELEELVEIQVKSERKI